MAYRNQNYTVTFESPINISHKYTSEGMAKGFQMGGPWGMLIGTIVGNVAGGILGRVQTKETWKQFKSMLKAADTQNNATLQEMARNLSEVSRERAVLSMETQSALAYTKAQANKANAEMQNTLAAADQVGSIVDMAKSQVALEASQQNWMTMFNYETQQWNLNAQAQNLINTADAQFVGVNVNRPKFDVARAANDFVNAWSGVMPSFGSGSSGSNSGGGGSSGPTQAPFNSSYSYSSNGNMNVNWNNVVAKKNSNYSFSLGLK